MTTALQRINYYLTTCSTRTDLDLYAHGRCHIFALALHKVFGWKIQAVRGTDRGTGLDSLIHMYCVDNHGDLIDAYGVEDDWSPDYLAEKFGDESDVYVKNYTPEEVLKLSDNKHLDKIKPGELEKLVKAINANKSRFTEVAYHDSMYISCNHYNETIEVSGKTKPTTNSLSQPIAKTLEHILNFWKWFGDSKLVDNQGRPIVCYHGTYVKFSKFNPKKAAHGGLLWFSTDKAHVESGAAGAAGHSIIMPLYVKLISPANWGQYDRLGLYEFKSHGIDGALLPDEHYFDGFVFEPTQLKSVKNKGQFSSANKSIYG